MRCNKRSHERKPVLMPVPEFWAVASVSRRQKGTPARRRTYRSQNGGERKRLVSDRTPHLPPTFYTQGKEKWAWFGVNARRIRLPAFLLLLMRLDQGKSPGGFRAGGRLVSLWWKEYHPSGQGCLHLGAKCTVCVESLPVADRQEDTYAKLQGQFICLYSMKNTHSVIPLEGKDVCAWSTSENPVSRKVGTLGKIPKIKKLSFESYVM